MSSILEAIKATKAKKQQSTESTATESTESTTGTINPIVIFDDYSMQQLREYLARNNSTFKARSKEALKQECLKIVAEQYKAKKQRELEQKLKLEEELKLEEDANNYGGFPHQTITIFDGTVITELRDYLAWANIPVAAKGGYTIEELKSFLKLQNSNIESNDRSVLFLECLKIAENSYKDLQSQKITEKRQRVDDIKKQDLAYSTYLNREPSSLNRHLISTVTRIFESKNLIINSIAVTGTGSTAPRGLLSECDDVIVTTEMGLYEYSHTEHQFNKLKNTINTEHRLTGETVDSISYQILQTKVDYLGKTTKTWNFTLTGNQIWFNNQPVGIIYQTSRPKSLVRVFADDARVKTSIKNHILHDSQLPDGWHIVKNQGNNGYDFTVYESNHDYQDYLLVRKLINQRQVKKICDGNYHISKLAKSGYLAGSMPNDLPLNIANKAVSLAKTWSEFNQVTLPQHSIKHKTLKGDCYKALLRLNRLEELEKLTKQSIPLIADQKSILCQSARDMMTDTQLNIYIDYLLGNLPKHDPNVKNVLNHIAHIMVMFTTSHNK